MSQHSEPGRPPGAKHGRSVDDLIRRRAERKRERLRADIQRNRKGDHKVPTWVLAVVLGLIVTGWIYLIITG